MTARTAAAIASLSVRARVGGPACSFYEIAGRDADSGQARRHARFSACSSPASWPAARRHRSEHRDGAAASQPAAHQVRHARDRRRRASRSSTKWTSAASTPRRRPPTAATNRASRPRRTSSRTSRSSPTPSSGRSSARSIESPLIVTGSVLFTEVAKSGMVSRPQTYVDPQGIEQYRSSAAVSRHEGLLADAEVRLHRRPHRRRSSTRSPSTKRRSTRTTRTRRRCRPTSS